MRRSRRAVASCRACGVPIVVPRGRPTVVTRVVEPDGSQTFVMTAKRAVLHQCRVDRRVLDGQLELGLEAT
jgi:hypothetical protein